MRFKVSSQKAREKILRRGMWNVVGVPMIVSKWTPTTEEEDQKEEAIPMWVHLEKVPLHMYSWEGLSFITSTVGFPVKPHPETTACTNLAEEKIFVKVDVSKVLPKEITFTQEGKEFTVKFYYPRLPARCKLCDKWGHNEAVCGAKGKVRKGNDLRSPGSVHVVKTASHVSKGNADEVKVAKAASPAIVGNVEEVKDSEGMKGKESSVKRVDKETVVDKSLKKDKGDENSCDWSTVSPAKTGRFLFIQSQTQEVVISASKFSVLGVDDVEEGELLEDKIILDVEVGREDKSLEQHKGVDEFQEEDLDEMGNMELDIVEDDSLDQQIHEEKKVGSRRRGRKAKAPDVNPGRSSRPRRNH